jgi:Flp pilus assembly protein TadD
MEGTEQHRYGVRLFGLGLIDDAIRQIDSALKEQETPERWNDWGVAQLAQGKAAAAERGFRRALELAPGDIQAAANLAALCVSLKRFDEAQGLVDTLRTRLDAGSLDGLERLLDSGRTDAAKPSPASP